MLESAKQKKELTVANSIKMIETKINDAVNQGKNEITLYSEYQYIGEEVVEAFRKAGYRVNDEPIQRTHNYKYTISW